MRRGGKRVLIIGIGEIGEPLFEIVRGVYPQTEVYDKRWGERTLPKYVDVMHICFPYSDQFVDEVLSYSEEVKPKLLLIESTVLPGTTQEIYEKLGDKPYIAHSPVRGRKADEFKWCYYTYTKFIGPVNEESGKVAEEYYKSLGFKTKICKSPLETEFAKIINTTYYGILISWWQEVYRICNKFGLDFSSIKEFICSTEAESGWKHPRPYFHPGYIGGHCVIPNAKLLQRKYPSKFIEALLESNEKRAKELGVREK